MKKIQKVMKSGKAGRPAERKGIEMHSNTMASCNKSQTNCKLFNNTFMGFCQSSFDSYLSCNHEWRFKLVVLMGSSHPKVLIFSRGKRKQQLKRFFGEM